MNETARLRDDIRARVDEVKRDRDALLRQVQTEGRKNLTARETRRLDDFGEQLETLADHHRQLSETIERTLATRGAMPSGELRTVPGDGNMTTSSPARVTRERLTYDRGGERSYFADLALSLRENNPDANERLTRHARELEVETRAVNRTDGTGGYLVPPIWLVDEYVKKLRAGRVTADRCTAMALPPQTDSINIPKVTTGTAVAAQTADNAAVSSQDIADAAISLPVVTIAGQMDASLQLVEQSALSAGFDQLVFGDLAADYDAKVDVQVLNGSGASGQATGILNTASITAVTYTDATPTVPELFLPLTQLFSQIASARFLAPECVIVHPRRWAWMVGALDSSNRPLVTPAGVAQNPIAVFGNADAQGGPVGTVIGLPVFLDANIPTNLGAGTNEDRVLMGRFSDDILMEGELRTRALTEILSGTLGVRFQLYRYVAFTAARYALANGVIGGTGLIGPSGY